MQVSPPILLLLGRDHCVPDGTVGSCVAWLGPPGCQSWGWRRGWEQPGLEEKLDPAPPRLLTTQQEAEANLRKAKQGYMQRSEDHDKARFLVAKAEEEQASSGPGAGNAASKTLDKRRRLEEEAKNKVRAAGGSAEGQVGGDPGRHLPHLCEVPSPGLWARSTHPLLPGSSPGFCIAWLGPAEG